jgi:hypothetical protein
MAQVSITLQALTPVGLSSTVGATTTTSNQPSGPWPTGLFSMSTQLPGASTYALFQSDTAVSTTRARCSLGLGAIVGPGGGSAQAGPMQFLVTFTAATPTRARLVVEYTETTPAGVPRPRADIDVGNDGSIDIQHGDWNGPVPVYQLGTQPLVARVILDAAMAQPGSLFSDLVVALEPANDVTTSPAVIGCSNFAPLVQASFLGSGIRIANLIPTATIKVFVLGLDTQPLLLPPAGPLPCLLLPRPDLLVFLPAFAGFEQPLPASARPLTLWVQGVELDLGALRTGGGVRVDAW